MKPQPIFAKNSTLQAGHRDLTGLLSSETLRVCSHLGQDSKSLVDDASGSEIMISSSNFSVSKFSSISS